MSLRLEVLEIVKAGDMDAVERLVESNPRSLRHLLALTYQVDETLRDTACQAVAIGARHHPQLVQGMVRRLIWAMNDESGTNALTAPFVIQAIALERPEILVPLVPDLVRLSFDEGLHKGLAKAMSIILERCPGKLGQKLETELNKRIRSGEADEF